mmetsp:Transcript_43023/g.111244  ORF Transcript_43023/g.111244 Transcript_43023/m.111244 type:complete len:103 (-) Transcript_43023:654-962(-)
MPLGSGKRRKGEEKWRNGEMKTLSFALTGMVFLLIPKHGNKKKGKGKRKEKEKKKKKKKKKKNLSDSTLTCFVVWIFYTPRTEVFPTRLDCDSSLRRWSLGC